MSQSKKDELILYFKSQWHAHALKWVHKNDEIINKVIPRVCDNLLQSNNFNVNNFKLKLAAELTYFNFNEFIDQEFYEKKKMESKFYFHKSLLDFIENIVEDKNNLEKRIEQLEYIITNN